MALLSPKALQGLYFFCEPLSEGSFGVLYVAIHVLTRQKVAIKILDKRKLGHDAYRVRTEIEALKQLNHKYIYKLYQVVETPSYFYLVVEYLPGGELFDYILQKERLSEVEARVIFRQIVSAIGYIHSKGFAHRDLKPENILLDNDQNVRIIDFGLCAKSNDVTMLNTFCGSYAYAAPEVLANKEYSGSAADLWSLGVILYALLCGCLPFDPTKPETLQQKITKGTFSLPEGLSKSSKHLLTQLLCVDPKKRIKIDELRRHAWVIEGFMGHPVDLDEERVSMCPLNIHIVSEITAYTGIPTVELVRMLLKRPYDYLMATYMIMESAFEEEDVFIRLHRRLNRSNMVPKSTINKAVVNSHIDHGSKFSSRQSLHNPPSVRVENSLSTSYLHQTTNCMSSLTSEDSSNENQDPVLGLESKIGYTERDRHASATSKFTCQQHCSHADTNGNDQPTSTAANGICDEMHDQKTLSPSRSVDSQLAQLTHMLYNAQINKNESSNTNHEVLSLHSNPDIIGEDDVSRSNSSVDECSNNYGRIGNVTGWRQLGRIKNVLTLKKPVTDGRLVIDRLRKTRHLNNVVLLRKDLSPGQVFDRISSALRQQSIRFTLKGSGFLCVFANDWGKTVLSFELELVFVSARAMVDNSSSIKRRLTLKPRSTNPQVTTVANLHSSKSRQSNDSTINDTPHYPSTNSSKVSNTSDRSVENSHDVANSDRLLGVKMKRLRGDSFMYTSLCRTILDLADVKQKD